MPKAAFSVNAVPPFAQAPSVLLIAGDVEFFVEEAAAETVEKLGAEDAEVLEFDDDAPAEAVSDALLNRSLFSLRRIVRLDITRLLGSQSPGRVLTSAVEAWRRGTPAGKREAFRQARALLSALDLSASGEADEVAEAAAKRVRRPDEAAVLAEILRELPEERGAPALLAGALRLLIDRPNDGTVALLTATAPPAGVDLFTEIARKGLVLEVAVGRDSGEALLRLARGRARQRDVVLDADAIERLLVQTDARPELFAAELEKLLAWAGAGGRVRAADVRASVEDDSSEDLYGFYDAIGRRDAGDALARLERLFSGRQVRAGEREVDADENAWPQIFLGMLVGEVRRMLLIRASLGEKPEAGFDAAMPYAAFQARVLPRLQEPVAPFGRTPFANPQGQVTGYLWYRVAQRAARYATPELARALARASAVDVKLKSSAPPLDTLAAYVGRLIAGN
ncbi:MAG: DNA polymerase III subunit delta [Thermoanaerobaculia bacterium]